ncbi:MAG TPA: hypothetical protein VEZ70_04695 [Allosphingosinicella sp.]|nr:hypothetical protein [Allosphingosinicella sp.]
MPIRTAAAVLTLLWSAAGAAQQPAANPALPQLLSAGYDLKTVLLSAGPCGNQPDNRGQSCRREVFFLQSPRKDAIFRCELGTWNGQPVQECIRI